MNKVLVELLERADKRLTDWLELNDCECESGHYCGRDDVTRDRNAIRTILAQQAEPAPALDVHYSKGFTDQSGDCGKFEAGINVGTWMQRIVAYGDTAEDAERMRDVILEALALHAQTEHDTFCAYCGGNDEEPQDHCMDCTRPLAQTEQQPVSWQFYQDGKWWNGDDRIKDHRKNTEAAGIPVRDLYAAPIAQTAPQPEQSGLYTCIGKGGAYELIGRAKTAGVLKVTGRFADEVIVYRDTKSNALYCREPGDFRLRMARVAIDDAMRQT